MTEDLREIEILRRLIQRTETVIASIERALPPGPSWLGWRVRGQRRRLHEAQLQLTKLIEEIQAEKLVVEAPVEPTAPTADLKRPHRIP